MSTRHNPYERPSLTLVPAGPRHLAPVQTSAQRTADRVQSVAPITGGESA